MFLYGNEAVFVKLNLKCSDQAIFLEVHVQKQMLCSNCRFVSKLDFELQIEVCCTCAANLERTKFTFLFLAITDIESNPTDRLVQVK